MDYKVFTILAPISLGLVLFVIISVRRFLKEPLARALLFYLVSVAGLLILNLLELLHTTAEGTYLIAKLEYLFLCCVPMFWLSFTYIYVDLIKNMLDKRIIIFNIFPILSNAIVFTNDWHHLFWKEVHFPVIAGFRTMQSVHGPFFWLFGVSFYCILLYGALLITRKSLRNHSLYISQRNFLILGATVPLLFNILYISNLLPFLRKDYTAVSFAMAGLFFYFGIYWKRFLQIVPIARNIIVQEMDAPVIVMDKDRKILDYNTAFRNLFGVTDTILSTSIFDQPAIVGFISEENLLALWENSGSISCSHNGKNYEIHLNPLYQGKSNFIGYLLLIMDVTQYINILQEKTKLISQLEQTNVTLKKTQRQLLQNEKLASIGQLAAGVAHEINNPTGFVLSNLRTLKEYIQVFQKLLQLYDDLSHQADGFSGSAEAILPSIQRIKEDEDFDFIISDVDMLLEESSDGAKRIRDIVQNLRDFARSDQEGFEHTDLNACIDHAIRISWNQLKYKCDIEKKLFALPVMYFNKNKIEQVLINILLNAVDAIEGHGKITIETRLEENKVKIMITDTGKGIPPENYTRVFDPFFTTKEIGKGTGLGMYISHQIVKEHGGDIEVESNVGKGTTMSVILPIQGHVRNTNSKGRYE